MEDDATRDLFGAWVEKVAPQEEHLGEGFSPDRVPEDLEELAHSMSEEAVAFVKERGLNWPWVAAEVIGFFWASWAAGGDDLELSYEAEPSDPPAPRVEFHFGTREGETVGGALERFNEDAAAFKRQLMIDVLPRGKRAEADREALERFAVWFYRVKVRGETYAAVAREAFGHQGDRYYTLTRRADIKEGVARAEYLLGLVPYTFSDSP